MRTPWLDEYFVKSSLLGTHSFFMICVPMPFWFGHADVGRGSVEPEPRSHARLVTDPCVHDPTRRVQ